MDNLVKITGKIHSIGDVKTFNSRKFQEINIENTDGKFPNVYPVEITDGEVDSFQLTVGTEVEASGFLSGRYVESSGRAFLTIKSGRVNEAVMQPTNLGQEDDAPF